ncbi:MAG: hypothetical protein ACM31O_01520 [Bacteroidota bacterium]
MTQWIMLGLLAMNVVVYAGTKIHDKIVMAAALEAKEIEQTSVCNARVAQIELSMRQDASRKVAEAQKAANEAEAKLPKTAKEIIELCSRSASCVDNMMYRAKRRAAAAEKAN